MYVNKSIDKYMILREFLINKRKSLINIQGRRYNQNIINANNEQQRVIIHTENPSFYNEGYSTSEFVLEDNVNYQIIELFEKENQVALSNINKENENLTYNLEEKSLVFNWAALENNHFFKVINSNCITLYRSHKVSGGKIMFHEKIQSLALLDLIIASKDAKLLPNNVNLQLMQIDRYNKNMPDLIIHLNNKQKITVQLKSRDIEKYGFSTENWVVTLLKDYKSTNFTFIIVDQNYIDELLFRSKNLLVIEEEDNIVWMTVNNKLMQENIAPICTMILAQEKNVDNNILSDKDIETNQTTYLNTSTNSLNQVKFNIIDNDLSLDKNNITDNKSINKIELAQKIQHDSRFIKLKSPDTTLFGTNLFISVRQAQKLNENKIPLTPANFFIASATGFTSDK